MTEHTTHWSWLEDMRKSPALYHAKRIAKTIPDKVTPAKRLGRAFHLVTLEPEKAGKEIAISPTVKKTTKAGKAEWKEFEAEHAGELILTAEEMAKVDAMVEAVHGNPVASDLLFACGSSEVTIEWKHEATGLMVSSRIDRITSVLLADLKGTRSPHPRSFARSCVDYGYHRQCALYIMAHHVKFGIQLPFVFVAVGNEPPHEVAVYELDDDAIDLGMHQNEASLLRLARCLDSDDWRAPYEMQANLLELPPWAHTEDVWEVRG